MGMGNLKVVNLAPLLSYPHKIDERVSQGQCFVSCCKGKIYSVRHLGVIKNTVRCISWRSAGEPCQLEERLSSIEWRSVVLLVRSISPAGLQFLTAPEEQPIELLLLFTNGNNELFLRIWHTSSISTPKVPKSTVRPAKGNELSHGAQPNWAHTVCTCRKRIAGNMTASVIFYIIHEVLESWDRHRCS